MCVRERAKEKARESERERERESESESERERDREREGKREENLSFQGRRGAVFCVADHGAIGIARERGLEHFIPLDF